MSSVGLCNKNQQASAQCTKQQLNKVIQCYLLELSHVLGFLTKPWSVGA